MAMNQKNCAKCGSPLVELTTAVTKPGNPNFPLTRITYKCTDKTCQDEIDKHTTDMEQQRLDRLEKAAERNRQNILLKATAAASSQT